MMKIINVLDLKEYTNGHPLSYTYSHIILKQS